MRMSILSVCIYACIPCAVSACVEQGGERYPWNWISRGLWTAMWNAGLLQAQQVLFTAEPSLWSHQMFLKCD